jgi:hypothetical protein
MPKRKAAQHKDAENESASAKENSANEKSAKEKLAKGEAEGGPLERQRFFMRQRAAVLRPREDSSHTKTDEESAPEPSSPGPGKKPS